MNEGTPRVLHPGDVMLAERGQTLQTLLGSCVALVLADPRRTVGAMCHIVHGHGSRPPGAAAPATAWGAAALAQLFALLRARGIEPRLCEAWAFGGGHMFPGLGARAGDVGERNAHWLLQAAQHAGLPLLLADLGGTCYRRLCWTVGPGAPQVQAVALAAEAAAPVSGCAAQGAAA